MNSPIRTTTTRSNSLPEQLEQIGLHAVASDVDDFLARATKQRWSPRQILEHLAETEAAERAHRSLERRLRLSEIKKFKPMADFDWSWPKKIERDVIERALTLDFLPEARNLVLAGTNGLGKTMIAQNICHAAVLAGHSVLFRSAASLLEELHRQSPEGRQRKLRTYANVGLLCVDEVGYLSFDDKSADLLYEVNQPALRTKTGDPHDQSALQRVERGLSQRRLHRNPAGPSTAPRRRNQNRRRQLPGS